MSEKKLIEIKLLKPGHYVLVDDVPCKVDKLQKSKSGKHGSAKARLFASGIFNDVKKIIVKPGDAKMDVPIIEKRSCQVIAMSGDNVQLMDMEDYTNSEVRIPDELKGMLAEGDEVVVWRYNAYVMIKSKK
jgi:translation initiation factor 5A